MALAREVDRRSRTTPSPARARWILTQAALIIAAVVVYFGVRGLTAGTPQLAEEHAQRVVTVEQSLGLAFESTVQRPFADPGILQTLANWIYIWGHWPVIIATMIWLAIRHTDVLLRLRDAMVVSGAMGMVVFASFPVAPPRLAGLGLVDTVTETSKAYRILQPPAFVNQYAAMPSLHAGWNLLVGMCLASTAGSVLVRLFGYLLPVLMSIAVVVTANHYVLDVIVGILFVLVGQAAALWLERRRRRPAKGG
ncbi:MAG TPA: phosphatase PAP2 family protein [Marmoricola sp.]|nr:phosphatase PAP2 family protein [Marmoricola sp.]